LREIDDFVSVGRDDERSQCQTGVLQQRSNDSTVQFSSIQTESMDAGSDILVIITKKINKHGIERVQAIADITRSVLCCHSNETRAQTLLLLGTFLLINLSLRTATVSAMSLIPYIFIHSAAISELLMSQIFLAHDTTT